jgi:hypothetical protein
MSEKNETSRSKPAKWVKEVISALEEKHGEDRFGYSDIYNACYGEIEHVEAVYEELWKMFRSGDVELQFQFH